MSKMQPPVSSASSKRLKMSRAPELGQGTPAAADGRQAVSRALELVKGAPIEEGHGAQLPPDGANKTPAKQDVAGEPWRNAALRADLKSTFLECVSMCRWHVVCPAGSGGGSPARVRAMLPQSQAASPVRHHTRCLMPQQLQLCFCILSLLCDMLLPCNEAGPCLASLRALILCSKDKA